VTVASGATLDTNFNGTLANTIGITINGGTLTGSGSTENLSNNITLGANSTIGGAGAMILNGVISGPIT